MKASRTPLWITVAGNCVVAAATWLIYGWNAHAAQAAARNTARFSALCFAVALAAPGISRWVPSLPSEARLIQSFVAAHMVHFAVVLVVLGFTPGHLSHNPVTAGAVILGGFDLVTGLGLMAAPRLSRPYTALRNTLLYTIFAIFFFVFVREPSKPLRVLALLAGVALLLRLTSGWTLYSAQTKIAN
jgi:hypothetical protein